MEAATLLALALALAMDAFAVAVGVSSTLRLTGRRIFRLSFHFGLFQFLMPIVGWQLGRLASVFLESVDHWVAFAILTCLGIRMIREAARPEKKKVTTSLDPTRGLSLVVLSIATSIDAFAAGLSLAMLGFNILASSAVIGAVACVMTYAGMRFGAYLGGRVGRTAGYLGGGVLIALGIKIVIEAIVA